MAIVPQCHDKISTISPQINSNEKVLVPSTISSYSEWPINPKLDIRILELLPASPDNTQIHGNLTVAKLSDNPSYEALSYVWGDQVFPEKLNLLPTGHLEITRNLAIALQQLRDQHRPRKLWVDVVCINQADKAERGSQVMLMAKIYRSATCVLG
jgi:hypothetical protein